MRIDIVSVQCSRRLVFARIACLVDHRTEITEPSQVERPYASQDVSRDLTCWRRCTAFVPVVEDKEVIRTGSRAACVRTRWMSVRTCRIDALTRYPADSQRTR